MMPVSRFCVRCVAAIAGERSRSMADEASSSGASVANAATRWRAAATASYIPTLMPCPIDGDIGCAASPSRSRPGCHHRSATWLTAGKSARSCQPVSALAHGALQRSRDVRGDVIHDLRKTAARAIARTRPCARTTRSEVDSCGSQTRRTFGRGRSAGGCGRADCPGSAPRTTRDRIAPGVRAPRSRRRAAWLEKRPSQAITRGARIVNRSPPQRRARTPRTRSASQTRSRAEQPITNSKFAWRAASLREHFEKLLLRNDHDTVTAARIEDVRQLETNRLSPIANIQSRRKDVARARGSAPAGPARRGSGSRPAAAVRP